MTVLTRAIIFAALLALCLTSGASATIVVPVGLTKMATRADTIVAGVVRETSAYWDDGRIYTDVVLETMEYLKNPNKTEPKEITITLLGGRVGDTQMHVSGVPRLSVDEEVLLFLVNQNNRNGIYGLNYGLLRIESDPVTKTQIVSGSLFRARTIQSSQGSQKSALTLNPLPPQGEEVQAFFNRVRNELNSAP